MSTNLKSRMVFCILIVKTAQRTNLKSRIVFFVLYYNKIISMFTEYYSAHFVFQWKIQKIQKKLSACSLNIIIQPLLLFRLKMCR